MIANTKRGGRRGTAKRSARSRKNEQGGGPIPLVRAPRSEHVYRTAQHAYSAVVDISAPNSGTAVYTTVAQLNGANALLAVFDQYRIENVTVSFHPLTQTGFITAGTVATVVPTGYYNCNVLTTCVDTDDAVVPGSEAIVIDHESCIVHGPLVRSFQRSYVPAVAIETYQTGGFGGYGNRTMQWLDSASSAVQHYGLKYWYAHGTTAPSGTVTMAVYVHATVSYRKRF